MLLYDRVMERAYLWKRRSELASVVLDFFHDAHQSKVFDWLASAPVYDISSVAPLFLDWEREREKQVPKRPPHEVLWCEWAEEERSPDSSWGVDWKLGCLINPLDAAARSLICRNLRDDCQDSTRDFFSWGEDYYLVRMFRRKERLRLPEAPSEEQRQNLTTLHRIAVEPQLFLVGFQPDYFTPRFFKLLPPMKTLEDVHRQSIFGLDVDIACYQDRYNRIACPWPPFMAFGLLHCKNVVTETVEPDPRVNRRVQKTGNPPRCTYKTLKIEVPKTCQQRRSLDHEDDENDGPKVRFHLCSGHFKNLQHDRYKSKGWHWWPAHWRGSKELGEVHKRYRLEEKGSTGE